MANRTAIVGGIWAENAPDPPGGTPPAADTTYANSALTEALIQAGWPHAAIVDSADINELLRRLTTLMQLVEETGILPWCASTSYPAGARAFGSDGVVYESLSAANFNHNPISSASYWLSQSGNFIGMQIFDTAGTHTYTPSSGAKNAIVEVMGAGGGGGGTRDTDSSKAKAATGGGAGGYAKKWIVGVTTQTITIGAKGTGGAKTANGTAGGTSSFGAIVSCTGGAAGQCPADASYGSYLNGSAGGTATGGDINMSGRSSESAWASSASVFLPQGQGSAGADSQYGNGGRSYLNIDSEAANGYGAGGGGSSTGASTSGSAGGNGSDGLVIVWEFA
jgi:hypothetical protein